MKRPSAPPDTHADVIMWWLIEKWVLNGFRVQMVHFRSFKQALFEVQSFLVDSF